MVNTTKPKMGAEYYVPNVISNANSLNKVAGLIWHDDEFDNNIFELGYSFPTYQEAYDATESLKFALKWHFLSINAGEPDNEWNGLNQHFFPSWDYTENRVITRIADAVKVPCVTFPSLSSLLTAEKILGMENVKKYILGVKE